MLPGTDLQGLVRMAREAEDAGFDAVMLSEHVVLGPDAGAAGLMDNPRDWAYPGNQDPATPWPSPIVLLSAIAAATTRLRLVAGAIISPLRHPLALAKDLAKTGVLLNTITPGPTATPFLYESSPEALDYIVSRVPMGRVAQPEEMAKLIAFLASEDISFSTGGVFEASGGRAVY